MFCVTITLCTTALLRDVITIDIKIILRLVVIQCAVFNGRFTFGPTNMSSFLCHLTVYHAILTSNAYSMKSTALKFLLVWVIISQNHLLFAVLYCLSIIQENYLWKQTVQHQRCFQSHHLEFVIMFARYIIYVEGIFHTARGKSAGKLI